MRPFERAAQPLPDPTTQQLSWAQIKGSGTTALFGQENVSSLTDNGAGDYTVTWAIPYAGASQYAVTMSSSGQAVSATLHFPAFQTITAGSVRTSFLNYSAGAASDPELVYILATGEF